MHLNNGLTSYPFIYRRKSVTFKVLYVVIAPFIAIAVAQFFFGSIYIQYTSTSFYKKLMQDDGLFISLYFEGRW